MENKKEERFWSMDLEEGNKRDLLKSMNSEDITAIVDEEAGGIIAYALTPHIELMIEALKKVRK